MKLLTLSDCKIFVETIFLRDREDNLVGLCSEHTIRL
jgi:hypothetical protein